MPRIAGTLWSALVRPTGPSILFSLISQPLPCREFPSFRFEREKRPGQSLILSTNFSHCPTASSGLSRIYPIARAPEAEAEGSEIRATVTAIKGTD